MNIYVYEMYEYSQVDEIYKILKNIFKNAILPTLSQLKTVNLQKNWLFQSFNP